jgi:hypothetical protein
MSEKALLGDIICPDRGKNEEFFPEAKAAIFALFYTGMSKRTMRVSSKRTIVR